MSKQLLSREEAFDALERYSELMDTLNEEKVDLNPYSADFGLRPVSDKRTGVLRDSGEYRRQRQLSAAREIDYASLEARKVANNYNQESVKLYKKLFSKTLPGKYNSYQEVEDALGEIGIQVKVYEEDGVYTAVTYKEGEAIPLLDLNIVVERLNAHAAYRDAILTANNKLKNWYEKFIAAKNSLIVPDND
jgi:hypothetical protein